MKIGTYTVGRLALDLGATGTCSRVFGIQHWLVSLSIPQTAYLQVLQDRDN